MLAPKQNETAPDFLERGMKDEGMVAEYPHNEDRLVALQEILKRSQPDTRRETRIIGGAEIEMRVEGDGEEKRLTGYAAKFEKWSLDLGYFETFREKIARGAFIEALKTSDVRALKNHDPNLILGRTKAGTLRLEENKVGLKFNIDMPNTTTGQDVLEEVRREDITGCSFAFTVDEDSWKYLEDGSVERTITKIGELFDVGPVTYPAYPDTTVAARSLEAFKDSIEKEKREQKEEPKEVPEERDEEKTPEPMDFEQRDRIRRGKRDLAKIEAQFESPDE